MVIPAPFRLRRTRSVPGPENKKEPVERLLVVQQWRRTYLPPPFCQVLNLAPSGREHVEEPREGVRVEALWSPAAKMLFLDSCGSDLPPRDQGRNHDEYRARVGGWGGKGGGRRQCIVSFVLFL